MRLVKLISVFALVLVLTAIASATASAVENPEFAPGKAGELFTGTTEAVTLQIKGGAATTCKKSEIKANEGELLGSKKALIKIDLKECATGGLATSSLADSSGIILAHIEAELCYISAATKHVGFIFSLLPLHIEIPAAKLLIAVEGSLVALIEPVNLELHEFKLNIAQAAGEQGIVKCEGTLARSWRSSTDGGAFIQSGLEAKAGQLTFTNAQTLMA